MKITRIIFLALSFVIATPVHAAVSPVAISIFPPVQFPNHDFNTAGVRVSVLWGSHRDMKGVDLGVIGNITEHDFAGIALSGLFNMTNGSVHGTQIAGLFNYNTMKADTFGLQLAGLLNRNTAAGTHFGIQAAALNVSNFTSVSGVQLGLFNRSLNVNGFQIGVINMTQNLHGVQIGLLNFYEKGLFIVSPVINIGFN